MPLRRRPPPLILCVALAAAAMAGATVTERADAEPSAAELAAARELFGRGLELEGKGEWSAALEIFKRVLSVKVTAAVRFHVALCLEKTGKLVEALNMFSLAKADAASEPGADAQTIATNAQRHLDALKLRIPELKIVVAGEAAASALTITVTIDGTAVSAALVGSPIPLDPGRHRVTLTASGWNPFAQEIVLSEGAPTESLVATLTPSKPIVDERPPPRASSPNSAPWVLGTLGVASLLGAGAMYTLRAGTISDLEGACAGDHTGCPPDKQSLYDHGKTYTLAGNVLLLGGVALLGTSIVLFALPSSTAPSPTTGASTIRFGGVAGGMGFSVAGSF